MGYQPPEVNNLNTPTPTGLNDYVWQTGLMSRKSTN